MKKFNEVGLNAVGFEYVRESEPLVPFGQKMRMLVTQNGVTTENWITGDEKVSRHKVSASWPLFIIGEAWYRGCNEIYDLQDGYGESGFIPAQGEDWSGIRDSSEEAMAAMTETALNFLFGYEKGEDE